MTIRKLAEIGIHGFSLYRFQRTQRNRSFWIQDANPPGDRLFEYVLFQCAEQLLTSAGYRKNHFAHFARSEDTDLYYRHAQRGEDLLALGPTADGVFDYYRYRHPRLEGYLAGANSDWPVLEGGLWENDVERRMRLPSAALMAAEINDRLLNQLKGTGLIENWQRAGFLRMDSGLGRQVLTGNGSWFINEMLNQLQRVI
jgi:coproporphyrinogen III oxidase-like Fe-S oxidoreductase